jgi:predicted O-linked N-acetylglucosamine transferase (SPINDLY family)
MDRNHMLAFARKPAPVQVTWLGYPGTTGLTTIDYRLSDPMLDPGFDDAYYSEKTVRLPTSFWCYDPLTKKPAVNELPALTNGYITFGCLNNLSKVTDRTIELWANAMLATPDSRLLLLAPEGSARQRALGLLEKRGFPRDRIEFVHWMPRPEYLETYHRIDICLDPYPCPGHTTSMDSLWMGVPVVNLPGSTAIARGGVSILTNIGLPNLIAQSEEHYISIASELAADLPHLSELRRTLRHRMESSPLMDAPRFAKDFETALNEMWEKWRVAQ